MDIIDKIVLQGRDISQFVSDMITHFRNLLLAVSIEGETKALDYSQNYVDKLRLQGKSVGYEYALSLITTFADLVNQIKFSENPRILLEVCTIKCCNPVVSYDLGSVNKRLKNIENKLQKGEFYTPVTDNKIQKEKIQQQEEEHIVIDKAIPDDIKEVITSWNKFAKSIDNNMIKSVMSTQTRPAYLEDDYLTLVAVNNGSLMWLESHINEVNDYFTKYYNKEFKIRLMTEKKYTQRHIEKYGADENKDNVLKKEDFTNVFGDFVQFEE